LGNLNFSPIFNHVSFLVDIAHMFHDLRARPIERATRLLFYLLKLLVERGANLGVVDSYGHSLLSNVARARSRHEKDERYAILLLDASAPIGDLSYGELMSLVKGVAVFNRLLARGVNFTAMRDEHGAMLCHHVARSVTREVDLRFLVNACGNDALHTVDNHGRPPLHWASSNRNDSAARVLVECGAEIDRLDNDGETPLFVRSRVQGEGERLLIALGADVRVANTYGRTACHFAALRRNGLCALVAAGGDLDQPDINGVTPRMTATRLEFQLPTAEEIDAARQRIAETRLDLVRARAFQICLGLQPLDINALQLCEILAHSFGALGSLIAFHQWWAIVTKVKHFRDHKQ
jgi:ankyrin repeat protein